MNSEDADPFTPFQKGKGVEMKKADRKKIFLLSQKYFDVVG